MMDRRFGHKVQEAILEVGPEFRRRTNYELEYTSSSSVVKKNDYNYQGRPVLWLVHSPPPSQNEQDGRPTAMDDHQDDGRMV